MTREEAIRMLSTRDAHGVPCGYTSGYQEAFDMAVEALKELPKRRKEVKRWRRKALQAEPVKHGKWEIDEAECIYGKKYIITCSECGESVSVTEAALPYEKYCRNCGAKMDKR